MIESASLLENARFNALVIVPNAVQGIFRRRPAAVAAATAGGRRRKIPWIALGTITSALKRAFASSDAERIRLTL